MEGLNYSGFVSIDIELMSAVSEYDDIIYLILSPHFNPLDLDGLVAFGGDDY